MTKKRLYVFFAFLFVTVMLLACSITLAACNKDEAEEIPNEPTHTHNYVVDNLAWAWNEDHTAATTTKTCTNEDGLCPEGEITLIVEATVDITTTAATCTEPGYKIYTATYEGEEVLDPYTEETPALGHDWEFTVNWGGSEEDSWSGTTATRTCKRDGCGASESATAVEVEITSENTEGYTVYEATVTFENGDVMYGYKYVEIPESEYGLHKYEITVEGSTYSVEVDETLELTATVTEKEGETVENAKILWEVKDGFDSYAIIATDDGGITGVSQGTAVIIATYSDEWGNSVSIEIYVVVTPKGGEGDYSPVEVVLDSENFEDMASSFDEGGEIALDEKGILTYYDYEGVSSVNSEYLETGGNTYGNAESTDLKNEKYTNYFAIDLVQYVGWNFEITISFAAAEESNGTLAIMENLDGITGSGPNFDGVGEGMEATSSGTEEKKEITITGEIEQISFTSISCGNFFVVWDSPMNIYGIRISLTNELYEEEKVVTQVAYVDFGGDTEPTLTVNGSSSSNWYEGALSDAKVGDSGIIFYTDSTGSSYDRTGISEGALLTGYSVEGTYDGYTRQEGSNWTNYFKFDMASLEGKYVVIEVKFCTQTGFAQGYVAVSDGLCTPEESTEGAVSSDSGSEGVILWEGVVEEDISNLYLVYSHSLAIYSIEISVVE